MSWPDLVQLGFAQTHRLLTLQELDLRKFEGSLSSLFFGIAEIPQYPPPELSEGG